MARDRDHHPHPRVRAKLEVLRHKSRGVGHTEIARPTELGRGTVHRYLGESLAGGLAECRRLKWAGR
jgi:DNA-binding IclR family transcriptional regulator